MRQDTRGDDLGCPPRPWNLISSDCKNKCGHAFLLDHFSERRRLTIRRAKAKWMEDRPRSGSIASSPTLAEFLREVGLPNTPYGGLRRSSGDNIAKMVDSVNRMPEVPPILLPICYLKYECKKHHPKLAATLLIFLGEWCPGTELNRRHGDFQSPALPTELPRHPIPHSAVSGAGLDGEAYKQVIGHCPALLRPRH